MKKAIIIILGFGVMNAKAQTKPVHISIVQGLSTQGKESKDYDYNFSFNLFSGTVRSVKGLEIGSLYNQNEGDMIGIQTSGLLNVTKGSVIGFQNAGLINISGDVTGVQNAGISNHAKDVKGVQIAGVYNQAKTLKGFQIGVVNIADEVEKGGGIGLINLYKKGGYREIELSAADYQNIALNFKSGTKTLYSIISAGYNVNPESLLVTGMGLGSVVEIKSDFYFKPEIIWYNYSDDDFKFRSTTNSSHFRFGLMKKVNKMAFSLYPSIYYANIPKNLEGDLTKISSLKPFTKREKGQWGFGIGIGVAFLK
jgi:hypothetical protein